MNKFGFIIKEKVGRLPKGTGVYLFKDKRGRILYIGKAANIKERVKNHFQPRSKTWAVLPLAEQDEQSSAQISLRGKQPVFRDNLFIRQVQKIGYLKTNSEIEALLLETKLIKKHRPKYNIIWKDDKNYFYVGITKEKFPQIFITHQIKLKIVNCKLKIDYIGPFVDGNALKQTLKILRKVFPYRSCRTLPKNPCLWHQLKRCPAACLAKKEIVKEIPIFEKKLKEELQNNAKNIAKILKGEKFLVLKGLKKEMKRLANAKEFEKAAKIRDQIRGLEKVLAHSRVLETDFAPKNDWPRTQNLLRKIFNLKTGVSRIEAYDVSNIQGQLATGSMTTFIDGVPDKNFYRKFKIKISGKPDDTAMIKEILARRFGHPEWGRPDLILIDGGKPQLNAGLSIIKLYNHKAVKPLVVALAKRQNELFLENKARPILLKALPRDVFNLLLQLRDEAHRFAIAYHKKLRRIDLLGKN